MKIFLLKNVANVGKSGEVKDVSDGFARNFILPRKLGVECTDFTQAKFNSLIAQVKEKETVSAKRRTDLSDAIETAKIVIKTKSHDGILYGSVAEIDILNELKRSGISISKNQIILDKPIKKVGSYSVPIRLSSTLLPMLKVKVESE
jgi:large subunit ribosomal protein L9